MAIGWLIYIEDDRLAECGGKTRQDTLLFSISVFKSGIIMMPDFFSGEN